MPARTITWKSNDLDSLRERTHARPIVHHHYHIWGRTDARVSSTITMYGGTDTGPIVPRHHHVWGNGRRADCSASLPCMGERTPGRLFRVITMYGGTDARKGPHPASTHPPSLLCPRHSPRDVIVGTRVVGSGGGAPCGQYISLKDLQLINKCGYTRSNSTK